MNNFSCILHILRKITMQDEKEESEIEEKSRKLPKREETERTVK